LSGLALLLAAGLARTPYVQSVGPDRAIVAWATDTPADGTLAWGETAALGRVEPALPGSALQYVRLTGLRAATEYHYQPRAGGEPLGPAASFRTAPAPSATRVRFAALGDFGVDAPPAHQIVAAIASAQADFVITTGDNVYPDAKPEEVERNYLRLLAPLAARVPIFPSLGNHDYRTDEARPFLQAVFLPDNNPARTERYYSFDWGPLHLVALDTECLGGRTSACDAHAQLAWAGRDLKSSPAPWKIVYFHVPIYSSGEHGSARSMEGLARVLEWGGAALVLSGHEHDYERIEPPGGVVYIVTGGGGAKLRGFGEPVAHSKARASEHHFLLVEIDGAVLSGRALRPDGTEIDAFRIERGAPAPATPPASPAAPSAPPTPSDAPRGSGTRAAAGAPVSVTPELMEPPLRAVARCWPDRADAPAVIGFDGSYSRGAAAYTWELGDGRAMEGARVIAKWTRPGSYRVRLHARDEGGAEAIDEIEVVVEDGHPLATEQRRKLRLVGWAAGTVVAIAALAAGAWQSRRRARAP
jgi:hypothetical protein